MTPPVRPVPFFRTERSLVVAAALVALLPVAYTLIRAFSVARDVAYWDELGTVLLFLMRLEDGSTWMDALGQLFALGNEHRTFTSRLLFAISYWLTGTVNFVIIGVIGNLFICGLCGLLVYHAGSTVRRVRLGLLLAFFLFQLEHYENFQWSGSSIDHFQVVMLAGASLIGLAQGTRAGWLVAILFALLATFTLAHGLVVWAVGVLVLATARRGRQLAGWLVAGAATALVFYGFEFNPGHKIDVQQAVSLGHILRYWLTLLGAPLALGEDAAEPFLGLVLLALLGRALSRGGLAREPIALPLALWAAGALLLVAIGRAELTQGHVYSRYYVLGALAWALVIFLQLEERTAPARPYHSLRWIVPLLALFNVTANARFAHDAQSWVICRDNAADYYMHYGRDGVGRFSLHPDPVYATQLLREVEEAGVYRMPRLCKLRSFPNAQPAATPLAYYVDRIIVDDQLIAIEGWAARPGQPAAPGEIHLILQSTKTHQIYTTLPVDRADVTAAHPTENWLKSGFRFQRRRWLLPAENFQIGLLISSGGRAEFVMTAHRLDMTGKGEGILAQ